MDDTDWEPIATAPQDRAVLLHSRQWGVIVAAFSSELGQWRSHMQHPETLDPEEGDLTHWRPLPQPPETAGQADLVYRPRIVAH